MADYFVDPVSGNDTTGDGSIGNPWQTMQKAATQTTATGTINLKSSGTNTLAAALTLGYSPAHNTSLLIQGYDSTQGDGGIGTISGGGSFGMFNAAYDAIQLKDLHLTNSGAAVIVNLNDWIRIIRCEIDGTTGDGIFIGSFALVMECNIHNCGGNAIEFESGVVHGNYCKNGTNDFTTAIVCANVAGENSIQFNICSLDGSSNGIGFSLGSSDNINACRHNSLYTTGTGTGILLSNNARAGENHDITNNLIEGFNTAIDLATATDNSTLVIANGLYDNAAGISNAGAARTIENETLSASPFLKSGSDTYALRHTYFQPVDTDNVYSPFGGMLVAKGAIQTVPSGGGAARLVNGGLVHA
jgi:hypothetical protein